VNTTPAVRGKERIMKFEKLSELPEWATSAIRSMVDRSIDRRVFVLSGDTILGGNEEEDEYSVPGSPRLSGSIGLMTGEVLDFQDSPVYLATQLERGARGVSPVCRAIVHCPGSSTPARFAIVQGRFGAFPATMGIRSKTIIELIEAKSASISKLAKDRGVTVQELEERVKFLRSYSVKSGDYWNWRGVRLSGSSASILAQLGNAVQSMQVTSRDGTEYPFLAPVTASNSIAIASPFEAVVPNIGSITTVPEVIG
jgi:hypothetical protein